MGRTGDKIEVVTYDSLDIKGVYSLEWGGGICGGRSELSGLQCYTCPLAVRGTRDLIISSVMILFKLSHLDL